EAARTVVERAGDIAGPSERRDDEHPHPRVRLADPPGHADPVAAGHLDVHHAHVGPVLRDGALQLVAPADLGDHLDVRLERQQRGEATADERLVIGQDDPDRRRVRHHDHRISTAVPGPVEPSAASGAAVTANVAPASRARRRRPASPCPPDPTEPPSSPRTAPGPTPSSTTRTAVGVSSTVARVAPEWRTMLVPASRSVHAARSAYRAGAASGLPTISISIPADRSDSRSPASSSAGSTERNPETVCRISDRAVRVRSSMVASSRCAASGAVSTSASASWARMVNAVSVWPRTSWRSRPTRSLSSAAPRARRSRASRSLTPTTALVPIMDSAIGTTRNAGTNRAGSSTTSAAPTPAATSPAQAGTLQRSGQAAVRKHARKGRNATTLFAPAA